MNSPINADGTEIEDAGCTHHHIQGDKDVTVDFAKAPFSHYLEEKKHQQRAAYNDSQHNKATALLPSATKSNPDSQVSCFFLIHIFSYYCRTETESERE